MRGSLQEQLLKSGLASEDQLKKPKPKKKPAGKNHRSRPNNTKKTTQSDSSKSKPSTQLASNKPEEPKTLGKALRTEIKQLLKSNKLNDKTGELPYNYVINNQVKRFYVNADQQKGLQEGKLVIVNWNTISYLITTETEVELRKLHPTIEVASVASESEAKPQKGDNDPYADYEIPDDITW